MMPSKHSKYPVVITKDIPPNVALYHDVGYGLRRAPSQRRRAFRLPIVYSKLLADLCVLSHTWLSFAQHCLPNSNNWDNMFMERLTGGIAIHRPVTAPAVVLALGNGFDFWAINAARKWPVSSSLF